MARINLNNYEAFLLDYFEGNLSDALVPELKSFVAAHPDLGIDLEDGELPTFTKDDITLESKDDLLKTGNNFPSEDLLNYIEGNINIAEKIELENRLNCDAELAKELEALKKTILIPDELEIFDPKELLFKNEEQLVLNNRSLLYFENELTGEELTEFEKDLKANAELQKELALVQKTKLIPDNIVYPNKTELKKEGRTIRLFSYRTGMAAALVIVLGASLLLAFYYTGEDTAIKNLAKKIHSGSVMKKNNSAKEIMFSPDSGLIAETNAPFEKKKNNQRVINAPVSSTIVSVAKQFTSEINPVIKEEKNSVSELATNNADSAADPVKDNEGPVIRYTNVNALALVNDSDDRENTFEQPKKRGFWKRAVHFAQQVNGLGIKAVRGDEKENENYSLSFNSFTVERK